MEKRTINDEDVAEIDGQLPTALDEIVRAGAKRMLMAALEAEVEAYIQAHKGERDQAGRAWWCGTAKARRERYNAAQGV